MNPAFRPTSEHFLRDAVRSERWATILAHAGEFEMSEFYRADALKYEELAADRLPSTRKENTI